MAEDRVTALEFLTNRYVDNVWRHIGIHLLAAGWVLSSAQLQEYLLKSIAVRVGLTFIFALMLWVHWVVNWPIYKHIKTLEAQIRGETKEPLADFYGISKSRFFWNEVLIAAVAGLPVFFLWGAFYLRAAE